MYKPNTVVVVVALFHTYMYGLFFDLMEFWYFTCFSLQTNLSLLRGLHR